jgi:predicted ArsR family transcriptional regulator
VSLPPRDYGTPAALLAEVVDALGAESDLERVARRHGRTAGEPADGGVEEVLARQGYAPYREDGVVRMRNCPFHAVAREFPPLVCGMNLALVEGLLEGMGETGLCARMRARPGECCVEIGSKNNEH